jgi:hypothetical protein
VIENTTPESNKNEEKLADSKSNLFSQILKFTIYVKKESYKFTIFNIEDDIIFISENMKDFQIKISEMKTSL